MSLMSEVGQKAFNLGVPLAVHMDVTYRCNERCVHCYLDHDDHGEMTTAEIKDVLDQLAEAGVFFITFSGGEVLLRRDFFEIVEYARRLMFNVKIKTNAVMIHEKEARRIRELGVDTIQISVYSHRPEVHDAITKLPHSFERTVKAIRFLREQGLRVTIANVLMTVNSSDHSGVQELAAELAELPQQCMRSDRLSMLHQWGASEAEAMDFEFGSISRVAAESVEGAARFAAGAGRHGASG